MKKKKGTNKIFKVISKIWYNKEKSKIVNFYNKVKNKWQIILFLLLLSLTIIFAYQLIVIYFRVFFQNFTYMGLDKDWVVGTIFKVMFLTFFLYYLVKVVLPSLQDDKIKKLKNNDRFYFVKNIKNFISKITIWVFVLIFVVLIIAVIGNGLFPLIFPKNLPTPPLQYNTHYIVLGGTPNQQIPKISNITCQSVQNKDDYVIGDTLNCNFLIYKENSTYSLDKIKFSKVANLSFYFSDVKTLPTYLDKDKASFSILLNEPEIKAGINYVNVYIDFKDRYNTSSTMYSVQWWIIDAISPEKFKERNDKKFAYLFALFAFSLVTGLSIVKNLKEIIEKK